VPHDAGHRFPLLGISRGDSIAIAYAVKHLAVMTREVDADRRALATFVASRPKAVSSR
jgi:hypothetical protein